MLAIICLKQQTKLCFPPKTPRKAKRIRSYLIQKSEGIFKGLCGRWGESGKNLTGKTEMWDSTWSQDGGKINS